MDTEGRLATVIDGPCAFLDSKLRFKLSISHNLSYDLSSILPSQIPWTQTARCSRALQALQSIASCSQPSCRLPGSDSLSLKAKAKLHCGPGLLQAPASSHPLRCWAFSWVPPAGLSPVRWETRYERVCAGFFTVSISQARDCSPALQASKLSGTCSSSWSPDTSPVNMRLVPN